MCPKSPRQPAYTSYTKVAADIGLLLNVDIIRLQMKTIFTYFFVAFILYSILEYRVAQLCYITPDISFGLELSLFFPYSSYKVGIFTFLSLF